jgi:hypothetical protein
MTLSIAMPVTGTSRAPLMFPASISRFSLSNPLAANLAAEAQINSLRRATSDCSARQETPAQKEG